MAGVGLPITRLYPDYYQRKLGASQGGHIAGEPGRAAFAAQAAPAGEAPLAGAGISATVREAGEAAPGGPRERGVVVALNGSPHCGSGNTFMMLEMLRGPLLELGFRLDIVNLAEREIRYCTGCGFCLEKGACWIDDDHRAIMAEMMAASAVILASPVYFFHVTAQMKTFIDRSLAYGHKPRPTWKPGLALSVSAGLGEVDAAAYLGAALRPYGAFSVGTFTALAVSPGEFIGKEAVEARAADLARDLATAVREKRRSPATERDLRYYQFMSALVRSKKDSVMRDDHEYWEKHGLYDGFETYIQQKTTRVEHDEEMRRASIGEMIAEQKKRKREQPAPEAKGTAELAAGMPMSCEALLRMMPGRFKIDAAGALEAVYQFEVSGAENFTAHLRISAGVCTHHPGSATHPGIVIKTPADVWLAVSKGEMDGQYAFMSGKFTAQGDLGLMLRLKTLFPG
jgi:multimeric flavodoxin WrbA